MSIIIGADIVPIESNIKYSDENMSDERMNHLSFEISPSRRKI